MRFQVQRKRCTTCIYRKDSTLNIATLEVQIADPRMQGYFVSYPECHHAKPGSGVCCAGFWLRHRNDFAAGQLAQRFNIVEFVHIDCHVPSQED